ncbi:aconitase X swivel domain-containing protein, partial [Herbidospora sp. RD11066]
DRHHPLSGLSLHGKILAIPAGRGSCTGSQVILELLLNGNAPAAIVLCHTDEIIALGAIVAEELFNKKLPVLCLEESAFKAISTWRTA